MLANVIMEGLRKFWQKFYEKPVYEIIKAKLSNEKGRV